ncbi:MAG: leucine-rich repeat domain-containing protein [Bacteroidales bacterium]|nr:leucine-rich repeat domain-containing protein [Bacteroidales bacterium]
MKNLIALVAMLLCSVFAWSQTTGYCGSNVTWTLNDEGTLTISGEGPMTDYDSSNNKAPWYSSKENITAVVIEEGVTSVGAYALYQCAKITSITIPSTVKTIGDRAFRECSGIKELHIASLKDWCEVSFGTDVYYSTSTDIKLFVQDEEITEIEIPEEITEINGHTFRNCKYLVSVKIHEGVTEIGQCAFYNCIAIKSITIPSTVKTIGDWAFFYCQNLTELHIPSIERWCKMTFGKKVFNNAASANEVKLIDDSKNEEITEITIPEDVTSINDYAFPGCGHLTKIIMHENVYEIGTGAFSGCKKLTSIEIPKNVTKINESTFSGCSGLTSIVIHENITSIGRYAFSACSNLKNVTIPETVTSIDDAVFQSCGKLESVTLPKNITKIGQYFFVYCSALKNITIPENVTEIGSYAFQGCSNLTNITIPEKVETINFNAFYRCSNLTSVSILSTGDVTYNKDSKGNYNTFGDCNKLKYVFLYQESVVGDLTDIFPTYKTIKRFFVPDNLLDDYRKNYFQISDKFVGFSYLEKEETSADEEKAIALTLDKESYDFIAWAVNNGEQVRKDEEISIVLSEDLDLEAGNVEWKTLGTEEHPFNGTFDGQQHNIKGNSQDNAAQPGSIFGHVGADAEISNVVFSDFVINATSSNGVKDEDSNITYYGLIAQNNKGVIRNCVVKGRIEIDANADAENIEACLVVDNEDGELDHVVGYFEGLDGEVTGNKASIIVIQNIGHGRTRGSVKKSASNGKSSSKGNSAVSAEVPDDINLNYRLFTNEEFAGPEPAYWLNFDGEGYSGTFTGEWTQGTKHPVAAKGEHGATVGVKYNVVNRDESVLGPSPVFFATSKSSLEVEYSEKPLSIEVNGTEINASQIGDMKAKFSLSSVNTDKGNVNVVLKYEKQSTPTAVDAIDAVGTKKAIKTVENGRVVIIRDGKKYDLAGRVLSDKF